MNKISSLIVTLFYIGKFPYMPGTVGSIFSFLILILINNYIPYLYFLFLFFIILITNISLINIYISKISIHDPKEVVIDEFLGCFVIFLFFPLFKNENIYILMILSFIFFRIFDIIKLFPINLIDRKIKNAYGVILDDLMAGIYTVIVLKIIYEYII